jgi:hypothetical protein
MSRFSNCPCLATTLPFLSSRGQPRDLQFRGPLLETRKDKGEVGVPCVFGDDWWRLWAGRGRAHEWRTADPSVALGMTKRGGSLQGKGGLLDERAVAEPRILQIQFGQLLLSLAQDASPGLDFNRRPVPQGRLKIGRVAILDNPQPSLRDSIMLHDVPRTASHKRQFV